MADQIRSLLTKEINKSKGPQPLKYFPQQRPSDVFKDMSTHDPMTIDLSHVSKKKSKQNKFSLNSFYTKPIKPEESREKEEETSDYELGKKQDKASYMTT